MSSTWTVHPQDNGYIYNLSEITVAPGGTLDALPGSVVRGSGTIRVGGGGTLTADGATFEAQPGYSYPGIDALGGSTVAITGSTLTGAAVAVKANPTWPAGGCATVAINDSSFSFNAFDIFNTLKDVPGGCSVDASGSDARNISFHNHSCVHTIDPRLSYTLFIWDVSGIFRDGECPELPYKEVKPHP